MEKHDQDSFKAVAARAAVEGIQDGMIIGLGTGSTAAFAVAEIGRRVAAGLKIVGIPTSERTAEQARSLNIPLASLAEYPQIDVTIDGADEVETSTLHLIKGRGGALLREKIVASASQRLVIIVDETKIVEQLGVHDAVPVEVVPFGWQATARRLRDLGADPVLRLRPDGNPFVTDGHHYILDSSFGVIPDAPKLEAALNSTVGIVETGLFLGFPCTVIVGSDQGVRVLGGR